MGKMMNCKDLQKQRTCRPLLAISLAASLAAFGCTTSLNPGNGTPTQSDPVMRSTPTSRAPMGSETLTLPPPMTSSYTGPQGSIRRSPDEAAAIMAQHQPLRGRYLGVTNPGPSGRASISDGRTSPYVNPALLARPYSTVNSSISSPPTAVVSSGAGEGAAAPAPAGFSAGVVNTVDSEAAALFSSVDTPITAANPTTLTPGAFGAVRSPAEVAANLPTITGASAGQVTGRAVTPTPAPAPATAAVTSTPSGTVAAPVAPVRIIRSANGRVTMTNVQQQ
jgi:hypothetical protein